VLPQGVEVDRMISVRGKSLHRLEPSENRWFAEMGFKETYKVDSFHTIKVARQDAMNINNNLNRFKNENTTVTKDTPSSSEPIAKSEGNGIAMSSDSGPSVD